MPLTLRIHSEPLSLCQLAPDASVPADIIAHPMTGFFRTHDEVTLWCPTSLAPKNAKTESGFIALEFIGPFEFALTGILTQIANPLAAAGVSIVPLSSFSTDYILIKADQQQAAIEAIQKAGHTLIGATESQPLVIPAKAGIQQRASAR